MQEILTRVLSMCVEAHADYIAKHNAAMHKQLGQGVWVWHCRKLDNFDQVATIPPFYITKHQLTMFTNDLFTYECIERDSKLDGVGLILFCNKLDVHSNDDKTITCDLTVHGRYINANLSD